MHTQDVNKRKETSAHCGSRVLTPREVAQQSDVVFMCVGNDNDVRSVVFGDGGVLAGLKSGSVLVDHTTASATLARELADACAAVKSLGPSDPAGFLEAFWFLNQSWRAPPQLRRTQRGSISQYAIEQKDVGSTG